VGQQVVPSKAVAEDACIYVLPGRDFTSAAVRLDVDRGDGAKAAFDDLRSSPPEGLTVENLPDLGDDAYVSRSADGTEQAVSAFEDGVVHDLGVGPTTHGETLIEAMRGILRRAHAKR
jgi:hypothetical protein